MHRRGWGLARLPLAVAVGATVALSAPVGGTAAAAAGEHWVGTWAAAPEDSTNTANEQTYRFMVHTSIAGSTERIRLTNAFGTQSVSFGAAYLGLRDSGAALVAGSNRQLTFGGRPQVTIRVGEEIYSDPVNVPVAAQKDLAVSLYIKGPTGPVTLHAGAFKTSYFSDSGSGNHAGEEGAASYNNMLQSWYFLSGVDVVAPPGVSTVVAFGDSITDGFRSTVDADTRYPDDLARRLLQRAGGEDRSVVNEGLSANEVTRDNPGGGVAAVKRLDRDVLAQAGVSHVILLEGINDISAGVSAQDIIAGYRDIIARVHARGLRIIGGTLTPAFPLVYANGEEATRQAVNDFIRNSGEFDGIADFDAAIRDPLFPAAMQPQYAGDGLHPNDAGYAAMANAIDLALLESDNAQPVLPEAPYAALLPIAALLTVAGALVRRRRRPLVAPG